ncbi:MAG: ABC transporter permease [Firmicutes bacterium]|nr:ABC transporter permease [Bacillota bacterium]
MKAIAESSDHQTSMITRLTRMLSQSGIFLVFVAIVFICSLLSPVFLRPANLLNILRQIAINGIISIGMTTVILTGGIDLSVGSVLALVTVTIAKNQTLPAAVLALIGIGIGAACGFMNGVGIAKVKLQPFIMTLAMMAIVRGLAFMYSMGLPLPIDNETFLNVGNGFIGRVPLPAVYFIVLLLIAAVVLKYSPFGRYIYAMGSNEEATRLSGVNVVFQKITAYIVVGVMAGVAGVIYASQLGIGVALAGQGYETNAIAAVVIGGTSMAGGEGSIWGTLAGVLIMGAISNIMNLTGVNPFAQEFVKGLIIIGAVTMNRLAKGRR